MNNICNSKKLENKLANSELPKATQVQQTAPVISALDALSIFKTCSNAINK